MNRRTFNSILMGTCGAALLGPAAAQSRPVPPEFVDLGVQQDGQWISPQFGVQIDWEEPFVLDYTPGASIFTNEVGDQFNIALPDSKGLFNASLSGPSNTNYSPFEEARKNTEEFEEAHNQTFLLFEVKEDVVGALIVLEWGKSALDGTDILNQIYLIQTYPSANNADVVVHTRIDARYDRIEDYVISLADHVKVDGVPALRAFEVEEVLDALKNLPVE